MKPRKTRELEWQQLGNVYLLIDKQNNKTFTLDAISFLVWMQCDGSKDIEDLVDLFAINGNRDIVRSAVLNILENLKNLNLIEW